MSESSRDKKINFIVNIFFIVVLFLVIIFVLRYVYLFFPFLIGLLFAAILYPIVKILKNKLHIPPSISSPFLVLALTALIIFLLTLLGTWVYNQLTSLAQFAPKAASFIKDNVVAFLEWLNKKFTFLSPTFSEKVIESMNKMVKNPTALFNTSSITTALDTVKNVAFSLPSVIIFILTTILSSILICGDLPRVRAFIYKQISPKGREIIYETKEFLTKTVGRMLRAYIIIMCVTFVELSISFSIIGIKQPIMLAFIIAVIDILPILGCGAILIPWALISLINDSIVLGVSLLLTYLVITIVRQLIEPRIVGGQIGLNPLVTLMCIYVGYKLLGFGGMFLFPIIAITIVRLQEGGHIHLWKPIDLEDYK